MKRVKYTDLMKEVERLHDKHYKKIPKSVVAYCEKHKPTRDISKCERAFLDFEIYEELTTCEGWQIDRVYFADYKFYKNGNVKLDNVYMCYERWYSPIHKKCVLYGKYVGMFSSRRRIPFSLCWWTLMGGQAHKNPFPHNSPYGGWYLSPDSWYNGWHTKLLPRQRILPYFKQRGFRFINGADTSIVLNAFLVNETKVETLAKIPDGQFLLHALIRNGEKRIVKYWDSIMVARRHGVDFREMPVESYLDYLEALDYCKKDLHNPVFVAPKDYQTAHFMWIDRMARKKNEQNRATEMEKIIDWEKKKIAELEKDGKAQAKYEETHGKYFGLALQSEHLNYHVLKSVREFYEEGVSMSHCVFKMGYYAKPNSLIISATNPHGYRVETIEVNLKNWDIVQSRAYKDGVSIYHNEIIQFINANMGEIKKLSRKRVRVA